MKTVNVLLKMAISVPDKAPLAAVLSDICQRVDRSSIFSEDRDPRGIIQVQESNDPLNIKMVRHYGESNDSTTR